MVPLSKKQVLSRAGAHQLISPYTKLHIQAN